MAEALVVAVVGAESTGKTALARALATHLATEGRRAVWVPERLRAWCEENGRTPRAEEQAGIAREQTELIAQAAATHHVVVADTTALMTAVYSRFVFGDASLDGWAVQAHRRCSLTLLTAIDLPWVADPGIRDSPQVREPVDALLRRVMADAGIGWSVVAGLGERRLQAALAAVGPHLDGTRGR